ncbi:MAG: twitching motility protein PilT [Acidimicrobiia bacterium]
MPVTTAPVLAQVSRSGQQAQLRRFLRGCHVEPFRPEDAHEVGRVAGKAAVNDVVDVHIVVIAHRRRFGIVTSDDDDLRSIVDALGATIPLLPV